jgi:hypothetical protein
MAQVAAPDAANDLVRTAGPFGLTLPTQLLETVETWLLGFVPIEVALLEKGRLTKDQAFALLTTKNARATTEQRSLGVMLCVAGTLVWCEDRKPKFLCNTLYAPILHFPTRV